ncbi:MAG: peptide chain release factor N(5)-glutamine methyltransferase [Alphaproteobacteria bacterium]
MDKRDLIGFTDTPDLDYKWLSEAAKGDGNLLDTFIKRRQAKEPVAKIIGLKGFWTLDLMVSNQTLDPRPDSETIISAVLKNYPDKNAALRILDLGTGSGCLLLALLDEYKNATGIGMDASMSALQIAQKNVDKYAPTRAKLICRNWDMNDWWKDLGGFDIVVCNPPYIPTEDIQKLDKDVKDFDPIQALDGGQDGLDEYRSLSTTILEVLKQNGTIFFEIGQGQENDVIRIMQTQKMRLIETYKDFGGILRVLSFSR